MKEGLKKKNEGKGKESEKSNQVGSRQRKETKTAQEKESDSAVLPILASSLGLNRIKTRSGPLPQESFYGSRGEKGSVLGLGVSNPSSNSGTGGDQSSKKKEVGFGQRRIGPTQETDALPRNWMDKGSNSDGMPSTTVPSRDQSPPLPPNLQSVDASSAAGSILYSSNCFVRRLRLRVQVSCLFH